MPSNLFYTRDAGAILQALIFPPCLLQNLPLFPKAGSIAAGPWQQGQSSELSHTVSTAFASHRPTKSQFKQRLLTKLPTWHQLTRAFPSLEPPWPLAVISVVLSELTADSWEEMAQASPAKCSHPAPFVFSSQAFSTTSFTYPLFLPGSLDTGKVQGTAFLYQKLLAAQWKGRSRGSDPGEGQTGSLLHTSLTGLPINYVVSLVFVGHFS